MLVITQLICIFRVWNLTLWNQVMLPPSLTHTHTQYESRCDGGEALRSSAEPTPLSPSMRGVPQTRREDTTTNYQAAR